MSFWVILDDSIDTDELLAGAGAAALGAFLVEFAICQAEIQVRMRIEWVVPALNLRGQAVRDAGLIFLALWRRLAFGQEPRSGFAEEPVRFGPNTAEGRTRRSLLIGGHSVAPTRFVLGLDSHIRSHRGRRSHCSDAAPEGFNRSGEFELLVLSAVLIYGSGLVFVRFMERGL